MRPIFNQSHETQKLVSLFLKIAIDQEVSFAEASKMVGFRVTSTMPAYQSAKRTAERDHDVVIAAIYGFGFKRIDAAAMVQRAPKFFRKVRKGSRREAHVQEIAIRSNLPRDEMIKATENLSRLRILETTALSPRKAASNKAERETPPLIDDDAFVGRRQKHRASTGAA